MDEQLSNIINSIVYFLNTEQITIYHVKIKETNEDNRLSITFDLFLNENSNETANQIKQKFYEYSINEKINNYDVNFNFIERVNAEIECVFSDGSVVSWWKGTKASINNKPAPNPELDLYSLTGMYANLQILKIENHLFEYEQLPNTTDSKFDQISSSIIKLIKDNI